MFPNPKWHGLNGYLEVIETIEWGLKELGHDVSRSKNTIEPGSVNVLFGAQMFDMATLQALPANTIVYNLEQIAGMTREQLRPTMREALTRFAVWDYSLHNLEALQAMGFANVKHLPIGYAPILTRIPKQEEDIDVLFYGLPSPRRLNAFAQLCASGLKCAFVCGLYGASRDSLIARSKLILNMTLYEKTRIFEIVRVSYLLANRKAVVAELLPGTRIEEGIGNAVAHTSSNELIATCEGLVSDDGKRKALEESGFKLMSSRDIRALLSAVLT